MRGSCRLLDGCPLAGRFHLLVRWPIVAEDDPPTKLNSDDGWRAARKRDQARLDAGQVLPLALRLMLEVLGHRLNNAVGQQDSNERADQGSGDLVSDLRRRAVDHLHGDDDTEDGGNIAKTRKTVADLVQDRRGLAALFMVCLQSGLHNG